MPNLMNEFASNIIKHSDAFQSVAVIRRDAKEIQNVIMGGVRSTTSRVNELKQRNVGIRSIYQWFKTNGQFGMDSTYEVDDNTEFGFSTEEREFHNDDEKTSLDERHMKDLVDGVKKQQFAIGRQSIEAQLQSSAEIINTMNTRFSEMTASLRTISSATTSILKKFTLLVQRYETETERIKREKALRVTDYEGLMTIGSLMHFMKNSTKHRAFNFGEFLKEQTVIGEMDEYANNLIVNTQSAIMKKLISTKLFQKIFGIPAGYGKNGPYMVDTIYTKDRAIFDGKTRKSIVDIIPGYLKQMHHSITGTRLNISSYGTLTTRHRDDVFQQQIELTFNTSQIRDQYTSQLVASAMQQNESINQTDVRKMQQVLLSQYIYTSYVAGRTNLSEKDFANGGFTDINDHVVQLFTNGTTKDSRYWQSIMMVIEMKLRNDKRYRRNFVNAINGGFARFDDAAKEVVSSMTDPSTTLHYTHAMFDDYAMNRITSDNDLVLYEGMTPDEIIRKGLLKESQIPLRYLKNRKQPISLDSSFIQDDINTISSIGFKESTSNRLTYVIGIFDILNRGINVFPMRQHQNTGKTVNPSINTNAMNIPISQSSDTKQSDEKKPGMYDAKDNTHSRGGFVNSVTYLINGEVNNLRADFNALINIGQNKATSTINKALLKHEAKQTLKSVDASKEEKDDATSTNLVLSGLKTLNSDGEVDSADLAVLNDYVNNIHDRKKRDQLSRLVKDIADHSKSKTEAKSLLGKALLFIFGLAKSSINKVFRVFKPFLLKAGSFYKKIFKSAFNDITGGARAVKESLVGTKGNRNGLLNQAGAITKNYLTNVKDSYIAIGKAAISSVSNLKDAAKYKIYEKRYQRGETRTISEQIHDVSVSAADKIDRSIIQPIGKVANKFAQTKFGQGFVSSFAKSPEEELAKEKASRTIITPLDKYTSDISDEIRNISSTTNVFTKFIEIFNKFGESFIDLIEWIRDKEAAKAKREERKRLAEEKKRQQESEQQQEEPMSFMGNIGKMVGGFTQILGGIFRSVLTIIKTMSGLTAIMNIGEEILKRSLQPINKIFTRIYRMLKPIVRIITKTLKQIVELMTTVVFSIIDIIQPIFQALVPIIEALLETLTPILKLVTDLVNVILLPITATINSVLVPMLQSISNTIQFISGLFEMGFGAVMWGVGGVITLMGGLIKWLAGNNVKDVGQKLTSQGSLFMKLGANDMETAVHSSVDLFKSQLDKLIPGEKSEPTKTTNNYQIDTRLRGSAFDATYGSGDDDDALYTLGDDIKDAFAELRTGAERLTKIFSDDEDYDLSEGKFSDLSKIARQIIGIFTGEENETVEERLDRETRKQRESQSTIDRDSLTDDEKQQIEDMAYQEFLKNTNTTGMSEDKIQKKYKREKSKYLDYATRLFMKDKKESDYQSGIGKWFDEAFGENGKLTAASSDLSSQFDSIEQGGFQRIVQEYQASRPSDGTSYQSGVTGQSRIAYEGDLKAGDIWNAHKNKSGVANFMRTAFSAGLTGAQVATIASTGIWEDGGDKIFGTKSLTNTTYDVNGQQAVGIMNWMDKSVNYGSTVAEQLQYIKRTYFDASSSDSRARAGDNGYWSQDESAYRKATGRSGFRIGKGERYGPVMEQDLIEGSEQFFRTALVPACIHVPEGPRKYIGTAIGVYNWLIDNGYINNATQNGTYTGVLTGNSEAERIYNYLVSMGMSKAAAAGILGCFHYESGMKSNNLEDAYNSQFGMSDEQYTAAVDAKRESKKSFITGRNATYISGQTPGEAVGYGLAQFTSSDLKREIYENSVEKGKSISDPAAQLETLVSQLKKRGLYNALNAAGSPTEANKLFLWKYEAGTGYTSDAAVLSSYPWMQRATDGYPNAVAARHGMAEKYYKQFANNPTYNITPTNAGALYGGRSAQQRGSKADWIRTVAMMFEGYYNNGDRTYDAKALHKFKIRDGRTVSARPDCSGMLGTADYAENIVRYVGGGDDFMFDDVSSISDLAPSVVEIPPLPMDTSDMSEATGPIIINQYQTDWNLPEYIDQVLTNEYDIEATRIKDLANQIFDELPEYLEDDDDDEYDYSDDAEYIRQLAANFL